MSAMPLLLHTFLTNSIGLCLCVARCARVLIFFAVECELLKFSNARGGRIAGAAEQESVKCSENVARHDTRHTKDKTASHVNIS